ncbi:endonuclease [Rhodobacterales bacterium HKCCE3408]|nr:endonuclease [Rhodobacterales bacterium HKCCE3408]
MRVATYNVEWFTNLFDDDGRLLDDGGWSGRRNVKRHQQIAALGTVFKRLDADAVLVVEGPDISRHRDGAAALEGFARHFHLRARSALFGYSNDTQQEILLLYDPDTISAVHDPIAPGTGSHIAPRFDGEFRIDLDIDATEDVVSWSKPPLEALLDTPLGPMRLIGVHAKSKAPHGARNAAEIMRIAISNRRKQLAQCIWLRHRVAEHLAQGDPLIVLGDFNDGPGLDEYEELFGRSGVEIVMGRDAEPEARLYDPHAVAALQSRLSAQPGTARFYNAEQKRYISALLDYIMVSPDLRRKAEGWRIWHPFDDPECWHEIPLRDALLTASDHFPVTLDLKTA